MYQMFLIDQYRYAQVKEQLKLASFLGVEGGGEANSPLKSPTFICNNKNQCFLMLNFS